MSTRTNLSNDTCSDSNLDSWKNSGLCSLPWSAEYNCVVTKINHPIRGEMTAVIHCGDTENYSLYLWENNNLFCEQRIPASRLMDAVIAAENRLSRWRFDIK